MSRFLRFCAFLSVLFFTSNAMAAYTCTVSYTKCNSGYYLSGTSCLSCPSGFVCDGGTAKPYKTFYFNLNGGTGTKPSDKKCYYNQSCSLDAGTGTSWYWGGQVFKGWSNVRSGATSSNIYTNLTSTQVNSSSTPFKHGTTYYAQWTPCSAGTYKLGYGVAPATTCSSCSGVGDGTYKSSATGANSQNQCYKTSTNTGTCVSIPANCSSATCSCSYTDYYGTTETCTLNNVTSVTAKTNAYKASTTTCSACPSSHPYSSGGNINSSSCYKTCTAYDSGGYHYTPNATTVYYNNSCTYSSACITSCTSVKNTAVVASGTQSCTRSGCSVTNGSCYYSGATQTYTDTCTGYYTSTGCSSAGATCSGCSTSSRSLGTCSGGTRMITCPAGSYWDGSKCNTSCGNGYYCPGFSNVAETSLSSGYGRNACTNTKPSNSVYSGTATSNACPWSCNAGYYGSSANGNTTCAACGNGYFCTGGANRQSCASTVPSSAPTPGNITSLSNGNWSDHEHAVKSSDCICDWFFSDTTRIQYLQETTCSNGPSGPTYTAYSWCRTGYYAADPLTWGEWYTSCKACTNKPSNATYTSYSTPSSMYAVEDNCPWQCNANYYKSGNSCVSCTSVSYTDSGSDTEDIKIGGVKVGSRTRTKSRTCYRSTSNAGSASSSACSGTSSCGSWNYNAWSVTCNAGYHKSGDTCAEDVCYVQYYCNQEDESASESLDFSGTTEAYGVSSAGCSEPTGQHFTSWYDFDPNGEDNSGLTFEEGAEIECTSNGASYHLAPMYSKNTYTIKYNANGGTGTMADTTATYDVNVTLRSNTFTRTGYTFAGWATSATGDVAYSNGQTVKNLASSGTVTLYAKWTANTYTITLDDNNGSGGSGIVKEVYNTKWTNSGGTTITSVTVPRRSGYTFKGYYTATSGGTQRITAAGALPANTTFTSNTTLYAQWTANQCTINYSCNGSENMIRQSSGTGDTQTITVSGEILDFDDIPCPAPTGYTDAAWELYIDDSYVGDDYVAGDSFTCTTNGEEFDLRAYYSPNRFSISYAANGGTGSAPTSPTSCYYDSTCTAPSNTYTRTGYTFAGWKCTGGTTACDGDIIAAGGSLKNVSTGSTITLTAQWTANKYSCDAGYYLSGTSCQRCTANYYCPGGEWTYNGGTQGRNSCSTATNNGYPHSEAGSDAITDCYSDTKQRGWTGRQVGCTKPANAYSAQCNSCSVASCDYVAYSNESGTGDGAVKSGCTANVAPCTQTVASVTCNAGARRSSTTTCELCGTGTYMDSEGHTNTSCKSASPGHYVNTTGATKQTSCANWTYQPDTGKSSCIACPTVESGYSKANSTGTGWTSYESCVEVATSSPSYCTAGKLQKIPKSSGSTQWATATVNTALQARSGYYVYGTSCVPCSGGNYCTGGTAQPQKCVAGSYSNGASATCTACPAGTTTSSAGATGASSCTACSNATNVSSWATPSWKSDNTMTNLCYATGCKYGAYYSASNNGSCTLCSTVSNNTTTTTKISGGTRREVCAGYYISGAGGTKDASMCTGCSYVKSTTVMCDSGFELENGQCINRNMCIVERTYSTCEPEYYMTYNGVYDGTPKAGNACTICPDGYSCAGGQARPVKTLTFNLNGGAGTAPATITCNYGESCTLDDGSGTTWYRAGYKFVGWSTNKNATSGSTSASNFVHGNTLYAIWSACTNGTYKAAGVAAKNACSACQDLTAPAKTGGAYSTSPESAATAATACRYVGPDIETPANCHNVTKNTVAFNGSWGTGLYTVTAKKGSRVVTATGVAPTCTQCSGATYQSTDGYTGTSCTPCDSNYQANTDDGKTSASQCQVKCSAGYAVVKENQACETIQNSTYKGKYTVEHYVAYGSTSTIGTCPQYYQDGNGTTAQNQCINSCGAGTMVASANADCTTPNNTNYGSSWYTAAHNVTYGNTSKGLSLVSSCPTANYATPNTTTVSDHNAKADCSITCEPGTVVATADANCSTPDGSWYSDRHDVAAGSTSGASKVACDSDYANSGTTAAAHAGEASCKVTCPAGKWVAAEYEACVDLTSGYYTTASQTVSQGSVGTRNECKALNSFYTASDNGRDAATDCYGETTRTNWVKTPKSGQVTCDEDGWCPGGKKVYYNETGGRTACTANSSSVAGSDEITDCSCDAGYSGNAAVVEGTCSACGKGTYKSSAGNTTCTNAGIGYYVDIEGATTRKACTDFRANTSTTGTQSTASSACVCVAGRYLNGSNVCDVCAEGSYKSDLGNNACKAADKNYYVDGTGKTEQMACTGLGSFYTTTESTASTSDMCYGTTTAGKYIKTKNSSTQETCPAKSFCPATNVYYGGYDTTGGRTLCPAGYQDGTTGYSQQSQCLMNVEGGKYVAEAKESVASGTCAKGYAKVAHTVPYGETSSCEPCTGATYADETGLATCKSCPTSTQSDIIAYGYYNGGKTGDHTDRKGCHAGFTKQTLEHGTLSNFYCYIDSDANSYGITGNTTSPYGCIVTRNGLACDAGYYNAKFDTNETLVQYNSVTTAESTLANVCVPVESGFWSPADVLTRTECPSGYVHGSATAASENQCAINVDGGHYIGAIGQNSSNWGICVNWTYKGAHTVNYGATSSCDPCPAVPSAVDGVAWTKAGGTGWTSYANCVVSQTPANCLSGSVKKTASSASEWGATVLASTLKSDDGYYANALAIECSAAQPGYFATAGATNQTACVKGSYTDAPAQSACIACGDGANWGLTTTNEGQTSCNATCANKLDDEGENAVSGWVDATWNTNNTVSNSCIPNSCDAHHYMDADNAECPRCDSFANGLYPYSSKNTTNGPEACYLRTNLIPGHYIKEEGDDVATPCPKAMFSEGDEDRVVHYGETSECKSCQGNTYQDEEGSTQCKACPDGYTAYWGGDDYDGDGKDADGRIDVRSCRILCPAGSYIANAGDSECTPVGKGYWAAATTSPYIAYGSTSARGQCKDGKTTIGYGAGADEEGDCGRVLHVGDAKLYLRSDKKTELALNVKVGSNMFYGNMSTEEKFMSDGVDKFIRVNVNGTEYTVYDDSGAMYAGSDAGTGITLNPNNTATSVVPASYGEGDGLDWSATVDGVELVGVGACDSNAPSTTTMGTVAADGFEPDGSGSACWCKMTSPGQTSKWILATANAGDLCSTKCGFQCTGGFTGSKAKHISFRTNMYNLSGISTQ